LGNIIGRICLQANKKIRHLSEITRSLAG